DGDWDDPGEQILTSQQVFAGPNQFNINISNVPNIVTDGGIASALTYARFRLSSAGQLSSVGLAVDGEVEDYLVTLVPGNPPVAVDDPGATPYIVDEDQVLVVNVANGVRANDQDPDTALSNLEIVVRTLPSHGTLVMNADGSFQYDSDDDYYGVDTFTYQTSDGVLLSNNTATVTITVQEVNDIPTVAADSFTINEDQTLTVATTQLTANDTPGPQNESSQTLTLTSVNVVSLNGVPAPQSLTINSGSFTYTPPADFNGQVILQYTVTDNGTSRSVADPLANSGLITLTVNKINDPPVIGADTRVATEDLALQISASSLIDNDLVGPATATDEVLEGQVLAFAGIVTPAGQVGTVGTTTRGGTISYNSTTGIILYTPPTEYSGSGALADTFRYVVQDQIAGVPGAVATGTVTINVVEVNDPPQPVNDSITAVEDQNRQPIPPNVASTISATFLTVNDLPGPGNEAVQQTLRIVGFNST
ncbi:MAG: tandem-95 repeat protein, partial [Planctomycetales bacterium]|nr:tandem-95 repeat protein [Planctomycetales bacterium]